MSTLVEEFSNRLISAILPEIDKAQKESIVLFDQYVENISPLGITVEDYNSLQYKIDWLTTTVSDLESRFSLKPSPVPMDQVPDTEPEEVLPPDIPDAPFEEPTPVPMDQVPDTEPEEVLPPDTPDIPSILRDLDTHLSEFQSWTESNLSEVDDTVKEVDVNVVNGFQRIVSHIDDSVNYLSRRIRETQSTDNDSNVSDKIDNSLLIAIADKIDRIDKNVVALQEKDDDTVSSENNRERVIETIRENVTEKKEISLALRENASAQKKNGVNLFNGIKNLDKRIKDFRSSLRDGLNNLVLLVFSLLGTGLLAKLFTDKLKEIDIIEWLRGKLPDRWQFIPDVLESIKLAIDSVSSAIQWIKEKLGIGDEDPIVKEYREQAQREFDNYYKLSKEGASRDEKKKAWQDYQDALSRQENFNYYRELYGDTEKAKKEEQYQYMTTHDYTPEEIYEATGRNTGLPSSYLEKLFTEDESGNIVRRDLSEELLTAYDESGNLTDYGRELFRRAGGTLESNVNTDETINDKFETVNTPESDETISSVDESSSGFVQETPFLEESEKRPNMPNMPVTVTNNYFEIRSLAKQSLGE